MGGQNQNPYPQQNTLDNQNQIIQELRQIIRDYDDTPRMNPGELAREGRQRREFAQEERQRKEYAPEERQRREFAPEDRQRREFAPEDRQRREFAQEERQRRESAPEDRQRRESALEGRQKLDSCNRPCEASGAPTIGKYQLYECMDTESQMRRVMPARDPAQHPGGVFFKSIKVPQEKRINPEETVSAPLIRTYPQDSNKPQAPNVCQSRRKERMENRQIDYMGPKETTKIEAPWCKRNGLQDRWMEDLKYSRRSKDIYSTPHPCCVHQSWPYNSQPNSAGRMAGTQRDEGQRREQECCAAQAGRPFVRTPQREEYVVVADCEKTSLCHTSGRRPRDIAPTYPREYDGKPQCDIK